jgi:excisionase family DNA binding protein
MPGRNIKPIPSHEPAPPFGDRLAVSVSEACAALGVQRDTVYAAIARGDLTVSQIGRRTLVHTASIRRLLAATVVTSLKPRVRRVRHAADIPATP